jgi:nitrous oxide reductase accessory protein NosL
MKKSNKYSNQIRYGLYILAMLVLVLSVASSLRAEEPMHHEQKMHGAHEQSRIQHDITADMTCPVCGMYPARFERWQTKVIFKDGTLVAFDGCKDMFKFLLNMGKYDSIHKRSDVAGAYVKDFNTGEWISASDAYYVVGSSEMGPMAQELVPFSDHMAAMKFMNSRGGSMARYSDIDMKTVNSLKGWKQMGGKGHKGGTMHGEHHK